MIALNRMKTILLASCIGIAAAAGATNATLATDNEGIALKPLQAHTVELKDFTAVVYYAMDTLGNFNVITTIGPNAEVTGLGTQHHAVLQAGQSYTLNLSQGVGEEPVTAIRFVASEDSVLVAQQ